MRYLNLILVCLLFVVSRISAQYTHFNNIYAYDTLNTEWPFKVFEIDTSVYLAIGYTSSFDTAVHTGEMFKLVDHSGVIVSNYVVESPILVGPTGIGEYNLSIFKTLQSDVIFSNYYGDANSNHYPLISCVDAGYNLIWYTDTLEKLMRASTPSDFGDVMLNALVPLTDSTFYAIATHRWGSMNQPDSIRLGFNEFSNTGNFISQSFYDIPDYTLVYGAKELGQNQILIWGTVSINGDRQIFLWKWTNQGVFIDSLLFGNPDFCTDGSNPNIILDGDGILRLFYHRCLEDNGVPDLRYETHLASVNVDSFQIIDDVSYDVPTLNQYIAGAGFPKAIISSDSTFVALNGHHYVGMNQSHNVIMKIDWQGQLIWQNDYSSGYDEAGQWLEDIMQTSDGGYLAVGYSDIVYPDFSDLTKAWFLKIDACGYEVPSDCAAITEVEEVSSSSAIFAWPNPFHNLLKAKLPESANRVRIFDASGRMCFDEAVYFPNQTWDMSHLANGVYVMQVLMQNGDCQFQRIIRQ
jgi:Secretion system C-terminal sorting domain